MKKNTIVHILSEISETLSHICSKDIESLENRINAATRIFCLGAGRSKLILSTFCMRLRHLGFDAYVLGDLYCPPVQEADLLLVASGSGETTSIVALTQKFNGINSNICCFTSNMDSQVARLSDMAVYIPASSSLAFSSGEQIMRALFEQSLFILLESVIADLGEKLDPQAIVKRHANVE